MTGTATTDSFGIQLKYSEGGVEGVRVLITGAAGFLGSHLVDALLQEGNHVVGYDRLSTGFLTFLETPLGRNGGPPNPGFQFVQGDIHEEAKLADCLQGCHVAFHLAAHADVRGGIRERGVDIQENFLGTQRVLEAMRLADVPRLVYASSAVVYGEPDQIPTPENYRGSQTSLYGASKQAAEALIEAYATYYGFSVHTFRLVSLLGERYTHGVVFDFVKKLRADPTRLEILGNGHQKKSYLYVKDAVQGMLLSLQALRPRKGEVQAFNLGHRDALEVRQVADVICEEMGLEGTEYQCTGGPRGWAGDSPLVLLDLRKMESLGWAPTLSVEEAIRRTTRYLLDHPALLAHRPAGGRLPSGEDHGPATPAPSRVEGSDPPLGSVPS